MNQNYLKKTFTKVDSCYSVVNGEKVYKFDFVYAVINTDEGKIIYTINRSDILNSDKSFHYIERNFISNTERIYRLNGTIKTKLYDNDLAFEKAIIRIEKMMNKSIKQNEQL